MLYEHRQPATLIIVILGIALGVLVVSLLLAPGGSPVAVWMVPFFVVLMFLFNSLTVEVTREHIRLRYGPGTVRKTFNTQEVQSAEAVRNSWWYGWGLKYTPHGWLYNVSGLDAVELRLKNNKTVRIGTDDPQGLARAVNQAVAARH